MTGNNTGGEIKVFGDVDTMLFGLAATVGDDLIEDGDDIIEVGNNNLSVLVQAGGGNDKIIGGWGGGQVDKLYG